MLLYMTAEDHMDTQYAFKTCICSEYEDLLYACVKSLDAWKNRRDHVNKLHLAGKEVGDELLRLQADFATAYSRLEKHRDRCPVCDDVTRVNGRRHASVSTAVMDRKRSA